uniref:ATP-dependent DNA helicase RecQ n=1 Tax=Conchiformibius kuhniae TaxID=211502 RepID=A0A8T9MVV0_9NEIS|nr:hypothetical protein LVJ77_03295 [Conchiformibius kuhniae]
MIHYQRPNSVVAYYQQVGRAGRALEHAYGVLLSGVEDDEISKFFIESAFPAPEEVDIVLSVLARMPNGASVPEMRNYLNLSDGKINQTLKLLSLESPAPVVKQGSKWFLTTAPLSDLFWQRVERLTNLRYAEHRQMQDYTHLPFGEHMAFLIRALDGDVNQISTPGLPPLPVSTNPLYIRQAVEFLRRSSIPIEPRKQ